MESHLVVNQTQIPIPIVISGSRSISNYPLFKKLIKQTKWEISEIVHGNCPDGVDQLAVRYAKEFKIPENPFKADWNKHGRAAGPIRNREMVEYIKSNDGKVFVLHDGVSKGALSTKNFAEELEVECYYVVVKKTEVFTIESLTELEIAIGNTPMVSGDLARRLIKQLLATKKEYKQVAQDTKQMVATLKQIEKEGLHDHSARMIKWSLVSPTAKKLEELNAKSEEL